MTLGRSVEEKAFIGGGTEQANAAVVITTAA
jgi:hypothetical protein